MRRRSDTEIASSPENIMSDWTDNPFGGQDDGDNPFADASVASAQDAVPEYNPFDQPTKPVVRMSIL